MTADDNGRQLADQSEQSERSAPYAAEPRDWSRRLLEGHLPEPHRERWQPLRAGLLNIYLFQDERFPFADGRLLLRGTNATGKSRVLAFMLPFLLDGNLHPTRLEPDRDATRQVAWNLLMGEHRDRLGYTWLELGRRDEAGEPQYLTFGCGMRAVKDRGIVEHWFFITPQRIDAELRLVTPQQTALTKRQLADALQDRGQLFEKVRDYQRAVDDSLFRLGDRYESLIDLLLQLRQPQLAKKLDLEHLETALRESLPPLSGGLMATAAEAFRSLDTDRRQLQSSRDALAQTQSFLTPYRQHVRIGLRRGAESVRVANSNFESAGRRMRENAQQIATLEVERNAIETAAQAAEQEALAAEARIHALQQSDEARAASRLDDKRQMTDAAEKHANALQEALMRADEQMNQCAGHVADCNDRLAATRADVEQQVQAAADIAAPEALASEHRRRLGPLHSREHLAQGDVTETIVTLGNETERWRRYATRLAEIDANIDRQNRAWLDTRQVLTSREADHLAAAEQAAEQANHAHQVRDRLWQQITDWYEALAELRNELPELEVLELQWQEWAIHAGAEDPLSIALDGAHLRVTARLAAEVANTNFRRELLRGQIAELERSLATLLGGDDLPPTPPLTRDPAARIDRRGAPLWQLVDFAASVPAAEHAGWEAALEASGLLDAWIEPDGRLRDAQRHDTILAVDGAPLSENRQLARVLVPLLADSSAPVSSATVAAVLERIGVGVDAGPVWVDRSGRWRNGPLLGCWQKDDAQFIGPAARQRHRQRQTELTRAKLADAAREQQQLTGRLSELDGRHQRLEAERQGRPSPESLRRELALLESARRHAADAEARRREAAARDERERSALDGLLDERDRDAADLGLTEWKGRGNELLQRLVQYARDLSRLERLFIGLGQECARLNRAQDEHRQAVTARNGAAQNHHGAMQAWQQHQVELRTLEEMLGAAAVELTQRLADAREIQLRCKNEQKTLNQRAADVLSKLAVLRDHVQLLEQEIQQHDELRRTAVVSLQHRAERGLLQVAQLSLDVPASPWTLTQGIELARAIERQSQNVRHDDDAWQRSQQRVHTQREELRAHLAAHDIMPESEFLNDGQQLVHVPFRGTVVRMDQLADWLDEEVEAHERVLSEKERQIFEEFLLGEVGSELHRRLHEAAELVDRMNREVASRPMSTGMQMRFCWELAEDAAPDLRAAREVLMQMQETWTADQRQSLIRFLQRQIQAERIRDESASRQEQLQAALDYRQWHALRIERRSAADQPWRLLTRRTYGAGSGGEKAIALTVPQFAAAAAYYSSADKHAPRFILLDEALAGISADNRSNCLELLVSFDLDVVMTSESEQGCYPSVPALSICRLSRAPDLPVVLNEVFIWNGKLRQGPLPRSIPADDSNGDNPASLLQEPAPSGPAHGHLI